MNSTERTKENTFQAVSYDIYGKAGQLHEPVKEPIAKRLASAAANVVHGVSSTRADWFQIIIITLPKMAEVGLE